MHLVEKAHKRYTWYTRQVKAETSLAILGQHSFNDYTLATTNNGFAYLKLLTSICVNLSSFQNRADMILLNDAFLCSTFVAEYKTLSTDEADY